MHMTWPDPSRHTYRTGDLYAGIDNSYNDIGVTTERHALTVATSGAGKGAGVIIPNLLRWPHSTLVIDPKGEAAEATAAHRESMGQSVHVIDPFERCDVPSRFRGRFNPLDEINLNSHEATGDILNLADGVIVKHDAKSGHWDSGGKGLLAGLIAAACTVGEGHNRTLQAVDQKLGEADDEFWLGMAELDTVGDLSRKAAARMLKTGNEAAHFASVVRENTSWLSDPAIASVMGESTFRLSDLKNGQTTVYLVLPADYIRTYAGFFRVFVMAAIKSMAKPPAKGRCLFLLDEFFALGHIDEIAVSAGLMRGYGVHLWPFMQDLGQLFELYGQNAAQGFISNADLLQFFGLGEDSTSDWVSSKIGAVQLAEVQNPPVAGRYQRDIERIEGSRKFDQAFFGSWFDDIYKKDLEDIRIKEQNETNAYQHQMRLVGAPRVTPDEVRSITAKIGTLAGGQIAFIKSRPYLLGLCGWFDDPKYRQLAAEQTKKRIKQELDAKYGKLPEPPAKLDPLVEKFGQEDAARIREGLEASGRRTAKIDALIKAVEIQISDDPNIEKPADADEFYFRTMAHKTLVHHLNTGWEINDLGLVASCIETAPKIISGEVRSISLM